MNRMRLPAAAGGISLALWVLVRLDGGPLAGPAGLDGRTLRAWGQSRPPLIMAMSAVRLAAIGAGLYLLLILAVAVVVRLQPGRRGLVVLRRLTLPGLRQPVARLAGLGLTGTLILAAGPVGAEPSPASAALSVPALSVAAAAGSVQSPAGRPALPSAPIMRWLGPAGPAGNGRAGDEGGATGDGPARAAAGGGTGVPTPADGAIPGDARTGSAAVPTDPGGAPSGGPGAGRAAPGPAAPTLSGPTASVTAPAAPSVAPQPTEPVVRATWTLRPGDHLWRVAAEVLTGAWGRTPSDREIAPYWARLVELNRPHLPRPDNPDLVFPGDVVDLPPVTSG